MPKWEGHPDIKRVIKVLAMLVAVEIFPFTSVRIDFCPVLQIQGTGCGDVRWISCDICELDCYCEV